MSIDRRRAQPFTLLEFAALLVGGTVFWLVWQISAPPDHLLFSDFFQAYVEAGDRLVRHGAVPTWPINETCTEGFVNIPVLGWLFAPFALIDRPRAALIFMGLGLSAMAGGMLMLVRHFKMAPVDRARIVFLTLANGPLVHSLREGNTTHLLLAMIVLAIVLLRRGAPFYAGIVLGLCAVFKLPLLLFAMYFAIRQRWRTLAGMLAVGAVTLGLSIALFGPLINVAWYAYCVGPFLSGIMPGFNVQSLESFLFRLATGPEHLLTWYLVAAPMPIRLARAGVSLALLCGFLWLLAKPLPSGQDAPGTKPQCDRELLELSIVLTVAVVASPLSWSHYYLWLLLPWSLYLAGLLPQMDDTVCKWLMRFAIVLSSLPVVMLPTDLGPYGALLSRTVVSACFVGGALTLVALGRALWLATRNEASAPWVGAIGSLCTRVAPPSRTPPQVLSRAMVGVLLVNVLIFGCLVWTVLPDSYSDNALRHAWGFLSGRSDDDSWGPMAHALYYIENEYHPPRVDRPLYAELVFQWGDKYQYPPFGLFVAAALRDANTELAPFLSFTNAISAAAVVLTALVCAVLLERELRGAQSGAATDHLIGLRLLGAAALTLTFYPVVKAFTLGQIQSWLNALFAVSLLAWTMRQRTLAGLLIGACALIKPHYALLLAWAVMRREFGFAAGLSGVFVVGHGLAVLGLGLEHHTDYVKLISYLSQHGEAFYPNQSVNGLLNRLMSIADPVAYNNLVWSDARFPPFTPWVYAVSTASSIAILGAAVLIPRGPRDSHGTLDYCTMMLSCTIASPIAWEHHYGVLAPIYAVLASRVAGQARALAWLGISFLLTSNFFPITKLLAGTPLNVLQSYLLAGAVIALGLLYVVAGRQMPPWPAGLRNRFHASARATARTLIS